MGGPPMIECDMTRVSTTYEIKMKMRLLWLTMVSNIAKLIQTGSTTYDSTARLVKFCGELQLLEII